MAKAKKDEELEATMEPEPEGLAPQLPPKPELAKQAEEEAAAEAEQAEHG